MANEASYVPLGRDNSGAAVQLNPFDSSKIFAAYDNANKPVKSALMDSYGKPINAGAVHPNDQWYITESVNKEIDYRTKVMQDLQARKSSNPTPEQEKQLYANRAETMDRLAMMQNHNKDVVQLIEKVKANQFAYPPDALDKINAWFKLPANERIQTMGPDVQALPEKTVYDIFKDAGTSKAGKDTSVTNANGSGWSEKVDKFDPAKAEENFNTLIVPMLANPNSKEGRIATSIIVDKLKDEFKKGGVDWDGLTPEDQSEAVLNAAKVDYIASQKAVIAEQVATTRKAKQDSDSKGGKKKSGQPLVYDVNLGVAYKNVGENDEIQPTGTGQPKGSVEIVNVVEVPVKNDQFEELNKEIKFKKGKNYFIGTVENVRKYANKKGDWQEEVWATVVDKEGSSKEILLTGENLKAFKENYNFDPIELIERKRSSWENRAVDIPKPEDMPDWNAKSPEDQAQLQRAYERKIKAVSPPTPKEKGMLQKGMDAVKSFFTPAPAKTTVPSKWSSSKR